MKQQPPFVANLHGACVPYAVANALHFVESPETGENLAERMLSFYPAIADGYLIGEIDGMMKIVDPDGELLANILHYNTTININKKQFFRQAQLWEITERIKEMDKGTEYFVIFILFIYYLLLIIIFFLENERKRSFFFFLKKKKIILNVVYE